MLFIKAIGKSLSLQLAVIKGGVKIRCKEDPVTFTTSCDEKPNLV